MFKILFCFNCCGAPPSSRPARGKAAAVKSNEKLVDEANFKSLLGEKDQLLANQIHATKDITYGAKDNNNSQSGKILLLPSSQSPFKQHLQQQQSQEEQQGNQLLGSEDDSLRASTSAPDQSTFVPKLGSSSRLGPDSSVVGEELGAAYRAGESLGLYYGDESISPPSSIDIDSFRELPEPSSVEQQNIGTEPVAGADIKGSKQTDQSIQTVSQRFIDNVADASEPPTDESPTSGLVSGATSSAVTSSTSAVQKIITSTTKIGDYARLEYSPVEDLESVTTYSQSRVGSEMGGRQISAANSTVSRPSSFKNTSGNVSRRSSQGIESTSISIASQLSNEQFQQNLTNMLESANSPTPLYGTIGLPLGPPLEYNTTETAKTSPETTGAALTAASQDSLSGNSLDGSAPSSSRAATLGSMSAVQGAALVNDSIEDSVEMGEMIRGPVEAATKAAKARLVAQADSDIPAGERIESSLSMATTTSGGLTNPTPTPSEMSGTSQKKKSKLRAGKLFKRLKRGGSKKKSKDDTDTESKKLD